MNKHAHDLRAAVVGAGPNGLAAAIVLVQAGLQVEVFEAQALAGGVARTMELDQRINRAVRSPRIRRTG